MRTLIIILFLASSFWVKIVTAQHSISFDSIVAKNDELGHVHKYSSVFKDCSNEPEFIMAALFVGYKNFFSSQDSKSCTFTPSCSVYAIQTIKNKGFLEGLLDAVDRLTRCNGLTPENYESDTEQHLLIDNP